MPNRVRPHLNVILLGDVGAGKATQSARLAKKYGLVDFDMGRELTLLRQKDKKIHQIQERTADLGKLTPTKIVRDILIKKISTTKSTKGILFDGHPKMIGEAKLLRKLLNQAKRSDPLVIYLKISPEETVKRISKRHGYQNTKYKKRSDDTSAGLKNRAKYYRQQMAKVTKYLARHYEFVCLDGFGTPVQVEKRINKAVKDFISQ